MQPPRVQVTYVQFPLSMLVRLTQPGPTRGTGYSIVAGDVAKRLQTHRPSIEPDFGNLQHGKYYDPFVEAFRDRRLGKPEPKVIALLVTPVAGTDNIRNLKLRVVRYELAGFNSLWDPLDLVADFPKKGPPVVAHASLKSERRETLVWAPDSRQFGALIPLALVHLIPIPDVPANRELRADGSLAIQVVTNVVLSPDELVVQQRNGVTRSISIKNALNNPLVFR
jgi:hypothetical protein